MRSLCTLLLVGLMLGAGVGSPALAQLPFQGQLLFGRSSWENGDLSLFRMDRMPVGARMIGMGYSGLALRGGPVTQGLNAASILGVSSPNMVAESKFITGSVNPQNPPAFLDLGPTGILMSNDYRASVKLDYDYDYLALALPITLFGNRGALSVSYSRAARTGRETETRSELQGSITQQAEATFGIGDLPEQGMDVLTAGVARELTSFWDLGVNLNWYSGELKRQVTQGISIFGSQVGQGGTIYQQEVSSFNVDIGTQFQFGNLDLGGSLYLPHDLEYTSGKSSIQSIPSPAQPITPVFTYNNLDMTLNVPTMFGVGAAYHIGERLLVAADYWYRPWSKTNVTREALNAVIGFTDTSVVNSYFYALQPVENQTETFSANLENTNSFGFGLEYLVVHKPGFDVPIRVGYNRGKSTESNVVIPSYLWDQFDSAGLDLNSYLDLIGAYFVASKAAPGDSLTLAMGNALQQIDEFNIALFRNGAPTMSTVTLGGGVRIKNFTADLALAFQGYTWTRFFLQPFDPALNPIPAVVTEKRSFTNLVLSIGMSF